MFMQIRLHYKSELLDLLKRYGETISIYGQMMNTARLRKEGNSLLQTIATNI